jgi:translation initiation factor 1
MTEPKFLQLVQSRNFVVKVSVDTGGRKGKTVTVLEGLPKQELFLKDMLSTLKKSCGAGGTFLMDQKDGVIEIQGDHRDKICKMLDTYQMKYKR